MGFLKIIGVIYRFYRDLQGLGIRVGVRKIRGTFGGSP